MAESPETKAKPKVIEYDKVTKKTVSISNILLLSLLAATWVAIGIVAQYSYNKNEALQASLDGVAAQFSAPATPVSENNEDLDRLSERVSTLEQQVGSLQIAADTLSPPAPTSEPTPAISQEAPASSGAILQLQTKVANLERAVAASYTSLSKDIVRSRRSSLVITAALLREKVLSGTPYLKELATINSLGKEDDSIKTYIRRLTPAAQQGILTQEQLQAQFNTLLPDLLKTPQENTVIGKLKESVSDMITVRRVGDDVEGNTTEAIIARAEAYLKKQQLAAAVHELEQLQDDTAEQVKPWLIQAQLRLNSEQTVNELLQYTITTAYITPNQS